MCQVKRDFEELWTWAWDSPGMPEHSPPQLSGGGHSEISAMRETWGLGWRKSLAFPFPRHPKFPGGVSAAGLPAGKGEGKLAKSKGLATGE